MNHRRGFLKGLAAAAALCSSPAGATPPAGKGDRWRQRRIVWNNDGSDMLQPAYAGGNWPIPIKSADQFIDNLMKYIEGTQVDSIFYCAFVNEADWEIPKKYIEALGPNPCKPVVDFAHRNNMEFFWSIRMNDVHAGRYAPKASYWPPFRRAHPELLLANVSREEFDARMRPWVDKYVAIENQRWELRLYDPKKDKELQEQSDAEHPLGDVLRRQGAASRDLWFWAGYDWAKPEVQAHYLEAIAGACERYDLEGIEMDWCRHSTFFRLGQESRNIPVMNDFVQLVRKRLADLGKKRGRPILLATKVPDSIDLCLALGLDPETWVRRGWIDLLMAGSGAMPFSIDMGEWVGLGRQYNIPVYGSLDRIYSPFKFSRPKWDNRDPFQTENPSSGYDCVSAACHRFWEAGVSGIYLYDWHTHHGPTDPRDFGTVPKVGEPKPLVRHNKLYCIDVDYGRNGAISGCCLRGQLPMTISTQAGDAVAQLKLHIADDAQSAVRASLQVRWEQPVSADRATWKVNGKAVRVGKPFVNKRYGTLYSEGQLDDPGWIEFEFEPAHLIQGMNVLEATVRPAGSGTSQRLDLQQVRVSIAYS